MVNRLYIIHSNISSSPSSSQIEYGLLILVILVFLLLKVHLHLLLLQVLLQVHLLLLSKLHSLREIPYRSGVEQEPLSAEARKEVPCGDLHPVPGQVEPLVDAPHDEVEVMGDSLLIKLRQPVKLALAVTLDDGMDTYIKR